ncbi:hypothetical protein SASPL_154181 [Salvia splendens]|uniref:Retrotransposon gag domain-containing protein n=1 Tax=Salvia splendens TaxID=180675 RepID=A0A8X8YZ30_SALSN|nr:hypothetical protein SASPL_154181 [Salvia splendens]
MSEIVAEMSGETEPPTAVYSNAELTQLLFDLKIRYAGYDKKLNHNQFNLKSFTRRQEVTNKKLEEGIALLLDVSHRRKPLVPDDLGPGPPRWKLPPSILVPPEGMQAEQLPREDNCSHKSWDQFFIAVKNRFDPELYVDHVGCLAALYQTSTVEAYQSEFEEVMQKTENVGEENLISLFIPGLQEPMNHELLTRRPATLAETFILAQRSAACHKLTMAAKPATRPPWTGRDNRPRPSSSHISQAATGPPGPGSQQRQPAHGQPREGVPLLHISKAERDEGTRRGLCWHFPEKYTREHVCTTKYYALFADEDVDDILDEENLNTPPEAETLVISGDVSSIHIIGPPLKPRSLRLTGLINGSEVAVLIDGGSTHNFIKPTIAEQLSLHVHSVNPFRVFVGNDASLRCDYVCLQTPNSLHATVFYIDLFILQVEGPDIILGVQWLQDLGDVTQNFHNRTMKFDWADQTVFLKGENAQPRQISYNNLFALVDQEPDCEIFELITAHAETATSPIDVDRPRPNPAIVAVIESFDSVFSTNEPLPSHAANDVEDKGRKSRGRTRETPRKERPQRVRSRPAKFRDFISL